MSRIDRIKRAHLLAEAAQQLRDTDHRVARLNRVARLEDEGILDDAYYSDKFSTSSVMGSRAR